MTSEELAAMTAEFEQDDGKIEQLDVLVRAPRKTGFSLRSAEYAARCNANDSKRAERKQAQRPAVSIAADWLLANPGSDVNAIMSGAGVSRSTARSARLLVFPDSPRGVSGAAPSKRDAVIVLLSSPITDKAIAERVGCSLNYVHKIRRGEF